MRMSRNRFIIHFVISLKPDRPYKATVVYNLATVVYSDIPRQTVVYQLYITARGFHVAHAKCYIKSYIFFSAIFNASLRLPVCHFFNRVTDTSPDAESREEQDGGNHFLIGAATV